MSELFRFILSSSEQFKRARLPSLYSDFTLQRSSNPDGFVANVSAWENALGKAAQAGLIPAPGNSNDTLSLRTSEELLQALTTKEWGRPLALSTVIDEAVSKRHMIPLQDFLDAPTSIYSRSWSIKPRWLISWSLKQLGLFERRAVLGQLPTARYLVVPNVEEASSKVSSQLAHRTNPVDRIYSRQIFAKEASKALELQSGLTESDLEILLKHLARDKGVAVYDNEVVKFNAPDEPSARLSAQDKTIASLKTLIADLNTQVTALDVRINKLSEKAQSAVKAKNRIAALAALKSKKATETTLAQRYDTLSQLEGVYGKIEEASDQVAVVRIMEAGTGVLRNLHAQVGGVEKVDNVIESLREEMSKVDEIGQVMDQAGRGEAAVDEEAIDEELEALERQDRDEKEAKEAETTRKRLAELHTSKVPNVSLTNGEQRGDSRAADGTQSLRRLSLSGSSRTNDTQQQPQKEVEGL